MACREVVSRMPDLPAELATELMAECRTERAAARAMGRSHSIAVRPAVDKHGKMRGRAATS